MHIGGLFVNRRQGLGGEVVDLDRLRNRRSRRGEPVALALRDHTLLYRVLPVVKAGGLYPSRDLFGRSDKQKRLLQPGHAAVVADMGEIRREPIARRRRLQHDLRTLVDDAVGRTEYAGT